MESPNISELLLEVTKIEDLAAESSERADWDARHELDRVARGFRNLVAHPESYRVKDTDFRRWATALESELDRAEKSSRDLEHPEVDQAQAVEKLSASISANIINNDTQLSETQKQAFPNAEAY